jgi:hypothetical protein
MLHLISGVVSGNGIRNSIFLVLGFAGCLFMLKLGVKKFTDSEFTEMDVNFL